MRARRSEGSGRGWGGCAPCCASPGMRSERGVPGVSLGAAGRGKAPGCARGWFCAAQTPPGRLCLVLVSLLASGELEAARPAPCQTPGLSRARPWHGHAGPSPSPEQCCRWTVALRAAAARGRSQGAAEIFGCGAEAVSSAQHLPANEQLASMPAGMPTPWDASSLSKRSLAPESDPDPAVLWGEPQVPPSHAEVAWPKHGPSGTHRAPWVWCCSA